MKILNKFFGKKHYTLVISGGGVRGFYALGILKALEELDMKKQITAIYGVSAGAIIGAYRSAGYSTDWIFEKFINLSIFELKTVNFLLKKSLLKNDFLLKTFSEDLPKHFQDLEIPIAIGATDTKKGKYILYKKGNLIAPLLGSMSIPGIFPSVIFEGCSLMDGGLINNFPVDLAKKHHPSSKIIGIFLNKFIEKQVTNSVLSNLSLSYQILMRSREIVKFPLVDDLFYRELNISILSHKKKHLKNIFDMGYQDGMKKFQ